MKKFFEDFKKFISKGSVLNLAVGVIIGGAFGTIVTSLVNDIIMPPLSLLLGNEVSFLKWVIREAVIGSDGVTVVTAEIAIRWGLFVQALINFLLIAFTLFLLIRFFTALQAKKDALIAKIKPAEEVEEVPLPEVEPPLPSEEVLLLREIRDSLKK